jgi:invasin B
MSSIATSTVALVNRAPGSDIKTDYRDAASAAAKTQKFRQAAEKALIDIREVKYSSDDQARSRSLDGRPQLAPPAVRNEGKELDAGSRFVGLMATIVGLIGEASSKGLENRLLGMRMLAQATANQHKALVAEYESALADLEKALEGASTTEQELEAAKARVQSAERTLEQAQARLDGLDPESPEYADALAARDAALADLQGARQGLTQATTAHSQAVAAATAANIKADALREQAQSAGISGNPEVKDIQKANLSAAARMVFIMARFAELMGESADSQLEADKAMATKLRDAQAAKALAEAKKHEEEVAKAERLNKAMGCIGKVLGGLLTVISVVGAAFTGGASLALAAVGVALMAGDMIGKAITGVSFMEQAMKPLMDHVLAPLIKELGKAASWALSKIPGISDDMANTVGNIAGAIAGALLMVAAMVVVAVVAKGAAGRIGAKMGDMIGKHVSKMIPDLLKHGARSASKAMGQMATKVRGSVGLQSDAVSVAKYGARMEMALAGTEGIGAITQATLQVKSGVHQARAAEHLAAVVIASAIVEAMSVYIAQAVVMFGEMLDKQSKLIEQIGVEMQNSHANSLQIARNI